jgi:DNA-binding MarR family transcriptional regulator
MDPEDRNVNMVDPSRTDALNDALELFFFAYREFTAHPDQVLKERGLQRVHHRILYFVGRSPGVSVNGLLGVLGVSKQALHGPLRHLAQVGLVEVGVAEHDRRGRELRLTAEGAALEAQLSGSQRERMAQVFGEVGPAAEQAWRDVMARVAADGWTRA